MKDADEIIEKSMQRLITTFADGFNAMPDLAEPLYLAAMKVFLEAMVPCLTPPGREIFDHVVANSETVIMPGSFDPRRNGLGGTEGASPSPARETEAEGGED